MSKETAYEKLYTDLVEALEEMHRSNVRRTSAALKSLLIIPTVFLILLFLTNSNKTIFLVLWIVSMFVIAVILIVIEYQDYKLRKMFKKTEESEITLIEALKDEEEPVQDERIEELRRSIRSKMNESEASPAPAEEQTEKNEATVG